MNVLKFVWAAVMLGSFGLMSVQAEPPAGLIALKLRTPIEVVSGKDDNPGLGSGGVLGQGKRGWFEASLEMRKGGEDKPAPVKARTVLGKQEVFPIEIEYPHEDASLPPLRVKGSLRLDSCCGAELEGLFVVPQQARTGKVKIVVVWKEWRGIEAGKCEFPVTIHKPD